MTTPGILHVMRLLEIAHEWLGEMDDMDPYEDSVVSGTRAQIVDSIANLEAIL